MNLIPEHIFTITGKIVIYGLGGMIGIMITALVGLIIHAGIYRFTRASWFRFHIKRMVIPTDSLREKFKYPAVNSNPYIRKYAILYRHRNIKLANKKT